MTKIAVIMGGRSYEREVSLVTGKQVADALLSRGYEVVCLDITDSLYNDLLNEKPDCVYIALHGSLGEDGCVQGLLEILGAALRRFRSFSQRFGMNKAMAKEIFGPLHSHSQRHSMERGQKVPANLAEKLILRCFKANSQGSAVGGLRLSAMKVSLTML